MHKLAFSSGKSLIHRLYPLTKLIWLILGSILIFLFTKGVWLIPVNLVFLVTLLILCPRFWKIRGFKFAFLTSVILLVLHVVFIKDGPLIFEPGVDFLNISADGLEMGLKISGRFLAIILLSYLFILTTEPNDLAYALMRAGLPYRIGFMLVTALRLSPLLEEEGKTIYRAQIVRGLRYDQGRLTQIFPLVKQFFTPVLISALHRVDKLVFSMEGRGFGFQKTRTFRRQSLPSKLDLIMSIALLLFFGVLLSMNFKGA